MTTICVCVHYGGVGEHIMISYQWDHKDTVRQIKQRLEQHGFKIWMDEDKMS